MLINRIFHRRNFLRKERSFGVFLKENYKETYLNFIYLDTRTEGNPEAWQTIRACISNDDGFHDFYKAFEDFFIGSAGLFLSASGLEMIKSSIQSVFDETGSLKEKD